MATESPITLGAVASKKRKRVGKYKAFGDVLAQWRGEREIEAVARLVRTLGVEFDGATLRGWEYGWSGQPDPIRLIALAQVYGKTSAEVLTALAGARGITLSSDIVRQAVGIETGSHSPGAIDDEASTRLQQERQVRALAYAAEIRAAVDRLADVATALVEDRAIARTPPSGGRRGRKPR